MKIGTSIFRTSLTRPTLGLLDFGLTTENSLINYLIPESNIIVDQFTPRQVYKSHYSFVETEKVESPDFISASTDCAQALGLDTTEVSKPAFLDAFSGNKLLPGLDTPYCTLYGCHCYGQWFGQLGDGRAMGLGEVMTSTVDGKFDDEPATSSHLSSINPSLLHPLKYSRYELQLKGCGRSPYSRGFDGKAVLRSSVREYIVSEAMHHLRVPTTRTLSLIGTNQEVRRPWYNAKGIDRQQSIEESTDNNNDDNDNTTTSMDAYGMTEKFSPNVLLREPGAIVCRVGKSFLRVAQLELFAKRNEIHELTILADYVCLREFPYLLSLCKEQNGNDNCISESSKIDNLSLDELEDYQSQWEHHVNVFKSTIGTPERYIALYKEVINRNAYLVSEWLRVGYTQGNMNSDNTLLGGRTIDYGPYGWLEQYDPTYQPFTSDYDGKFCFLNQPNAMNVNMYVLSQTFEVLIKGVCNKLSITDSEKINTYIQEIRTLSQKEFQQQFNIYYQSMKRQKLGFTMRPSTTTPTTTAPSSIISGMDIVNTATSEERIDDAAIDSLWLGLLPLLYKSKADYTLFFRELSKVVSFLPHQANDAFEVFLTPQSVFYEKVSSEMKLEWLKWLQSYLQAIQREGRDIAVVQKQMSLHNPKYVFRNWMAIQAYERATEGDYTVIEELMSVLQSPYEEQSEEIEKQWYTKAPTWSRVMYWLNDEKNVFFGDVMEERELEPSYFKDDDTSIYKSRVNEAPVSPRSESDNSPRNYEESDENLFRRFKFKRSKVEKNNHSIQSEKLISNSEPTTKPDLNVLSQPRISTVGQVNTESDCNIAEQEKNYISAATNMATLNVHDNMIDPPKSSTESISMSNDSKNPVHASIYPVPMSSSSSSSSSSINSIKYWSTTFEYIVLDIDYMMTQLRTRGYCVINTTPKFHSLLQNIPYNQTLLTALYKKAIRLRSQPDRKRKWIRMEDLNSKNTMNWTFLQLFTLWKEVFIELSTALYPIYTVINVLGLLSGPNSPYKQLPHYDTLPRGDSIDPAHIQHLTILGYMEDFALDVWPGSHHLSRIYQHHITRKLPLPATMAPICVETVHIKQYQLIIFHSDLYHRGVQNESIEYKLRLSCLLYSHKQHTNSSSSSAKESTFNNINMTSNGNSSSHPTTSSSSDTNTNITNTNTNNSIDRNTNNNGFGHASSPILSSQCTYTRGDSITNTTHVAIITTNSIETYTKNNNSDDTHKAASTTNTATTTTITTTNNDNSSRHAVMMMTKEEQERFIHDIRIRDDYLGTSATTTTTTTPTMTTMTNNNHNNNNNISTSKIINNNHNNINHQTALINTPISSTTTTTSTNNTTTDTTNTTSIKSNPITPRPVYSNYYTTSISPYKLMYTSPISDSE